MDSADPRELEGILIGELPPPWQTPRLRSLAGQVVQAAEASIFPGRPEAGWHWSGLREHLWPVVLDRAGDGEPGWAELASACVAAADLLAGRSPAGRAEWPLARSSRFGWEREHGRLELGESWQDVLLRVAPSLPGAAELERVEVVGAAFDALRSPQVHVLLRGAPPARVLLTTGRLGARSELEGAAEVRRLLERFQVDGSLWESSIATVAEGRSGMAALFLRAVAEARRPEIATLGDVGVTGQLDEDGILLPVADLTGKVRSFFAAYPKGRCFVPVAQIGELVALMPERERHDDYLRPRRVDPLRLTHAQWERVVALKSVTDLLARLGIDWSPTDPISAALTALRERSQTTTDWRGRPRPVRGLAVIPLRPPLNADESNRYEQISLTTLSSVALDGVGSRARWVVTGRPGSGKSMVLRQLHHQLSTGALRHRGPSLLVPARRLIGGASLGAAIAAEVGVEATAITAVLQSRALQGAIWLLVDGLDELPAHDRLRVVGLVEDWPGPSVVATRGLPEQLPTGRVLVVPDLEQRVAVDVLESEGRADLAEVVKRGGRAERGRPDPLGLLRSELARTPLGLSILAMVWHDKPASRQDLLRDAVLHLIRRAEAEGRLPGATRRRFERVGLRLLGAAAWRMLREGRATLHLEDLEFAEVTAGSGRDDGDLLHFAVEQGGFVQPVGPGRWEFSHKSFAEFAAGRYLAAAPGEPWRDALPLLGEPAANEVLLHLAALLPSPAPVLAALRRREDRTLSGLRLATRILLEVAPGTVSAELLLAVIVPRLRLWRWLPEQPLPGGVGELDDAKEAISRHIGCLEPHIDPLLGACAPSVGRWARDPVGEAARFAAAQSRRWSRETPGDLDDAAEKEDLYDAEPSILGKWFGRTFTLQRDVAGLLGAEGGPEQLRQRGPGAWTDELVGLYEHPQIGPRARGLWWELRTEEQLLAEIPALHPQHENLGRVVRAVVRLGTPSQRREALLRATLYAGASTRTGGAVVEGVAEIPSDALLEIWRPAWETGVLAEAPRYGAGVRDDRDALHALYASFIDDEVAPARWRALVATRQLMQTEELGRESGRRRHELTLPPGLVARLRDFLADPAPAVRAEALAMLIAGGVRLPLAEVVSLLLCGGPWLRPLALQAAQMLIPALSSEVLATLLAADVVTPPEPYDAPPVTPWVRAAFGHVAEARNALHSALRARLQTWEGAATLFELAARPGLAKVLRAVVEGHPAQDVPPSVVRRALRARQAEARRWAVKQLGWRKDALPRELLEALAEDSDQEVADEARQRLERFDDEANEPVLAEPADADAGDGEFTEDHTPAVLDESVLYMPMGLGEGRRSRTVTVAAVKARASFAEAWRVLGNAALETQTAQDMDGYYTEDGVEFIVEFAQQAAGENRGAVREVFEHLRGMYTPEWREALIDELGHPSRGLFAKLLLSQSPCGRELLRAIPINEAAARRVTELAAGTPLAAAVIDTLVQALASGTLLVDDGRTLWGGYAEPEALRALCRIGGREGLIRLVTRRGEPSVTAHAVRALLDSNQASDARLGEGPAAELRRWVGERLENTRDRTELLRLLALCATESDAARWQKAVEQHELGATEVAAVATLVGRVGGTGGTAWLRALTMSTDSPQVVNAAFAALADGADLETARWMFERLDAPPPAIHDACSRRKDFETRKRAATDAAREAGDPNWFDVRLMDDESDSRLDLHSWEQSAKVAGIAHGDDELGYQLAWRLADEPQAIDLCEKHGRLPSHVLLVLGALTHDPGDHAVPSADMGYEVMGSGVPERVEAAVARIVKRTDRERVRQALLEAMLRGYPDRRGRSIGELHQIFRGLGGPTRRDKERLLAAVHEKPNHDVALDYLAQTGDGEAEVLAIWRARGVAWLP
ncbi:MAG: NACHT domain-containing protein [Myxococcota bacterium]